MATGIPPKKYLKHKKISVSLTYEGKEDVKRILSYHNKPFDIQIPVNGDGDNRLFYGDNLDALSYLLNNGYRKKIKLIYIDPPFATSSNFVNRKQEHAYSDVLDGGEYVEFLRKRIVFLYELLSDDGSIYLHLDNKMVFTMKLVMDEVFGESNCRAFITRKKCSTKNYTKNTYGNISDYILFYSKSNKYTWNRPYDPWEYEKMIEQYPYVDERTGRRYKKVPVHAPGIRNGETGKEWRGKMPPPGKHWQYTPDKLDKFDAAGEIYWSPTGNPRRMVFCDPQKGIPVQDIWLNYRDSINQAQKTTGYPTEKNLNMLKLIVLASSDPGDLVLDCFAGSGTTLGAAFENNRYWIGVDNSIESIKAIMKRFTDGLDIYGNYVNNQEYVKSTLDFMGKCSFSIITSKENEKNISDLCI
ncbi:site-specific DNA-methyltransferase [Pectinatus sottacetonis]|uniref:site-specific DNA-methyltransferase n=1 Tax=Pectinatus sottacetonis TaxID=1002795 RepID=UPI0018C4AB04|nr:site-specific DNA-methyltransferase [Pectinatus sottacetonis]